MNAKEKATDPLAPSLGRLFRFVTFALTSEGIRQGLESARSNPMMTIVRRKTHPLLGGLIALFLLQWALALAAGWWMRRLINLTYPPSSLFAYLILGLQISTSIGWEIFRLILPVLCARWLYREFWTRQDQLRLIPMTFEQHLFGLLLPVLVPILGVKLIIHLISDGQQWITPFANENWFFLPLRKTLLKEFIGGVLPLIRDILAVLQYGLLFSVLFVRALVRDREPLPRSRAFMRRLWTPVGVLIAFSCVMPPIYWIIARLCSQEAFILIMQIMSSGILLVQFPILYWFWRMDIPLARAWVFRGE